MLPFDTIKFCLICVCLWTGARLLGRGAQRCGLSAVLGELAWGMIAGALWTAFDGPLPRPEWLHVVSEVGVVLLLFGVGLETNGSELRAVGPRAARVAAVGVALPLLVGAGVSWLWGAAPGALGHWFVGATLTATSVGVTVRVLQELGQGETLEAKIILAAAVVDDVLGLLLLAALTAGGGALGGLALKLALFFAVVAWLHPWLRRRAAGLLLGTPASFVFALGVLALYAGGAQAAGLAYPLGAFLAGLALAPFAHARGGRIPGIPALEKLFVPLFFAITGTAFNARAFAEPSALLLCGTLLVVAVVGKWAAGWVAGRGVRPSLIGFGMVPRGEVGLIFVALGLAGNPPPLPPATTSALLGVVALTTLLAPLVLRALVSVPSARTAGPG